MKGLVTTKLEIRRDLLGNIAVRDNDYYYMQRFTNINPQQGIYYMMQHYFMYGWKSVIHHFDCWGSTKLEEAIGDLLKNNQNIRNFDVTVVEKSKTIVVSWEQTEGINKFGKMSIVWEVEK